MDSTSHSVSCFLKRPCLRISFQRPHLDENTDDVRKVGFESIACQGVLSAESFNYQTESIRDDRLISPVNEQVLLHSEALRASVAVEAVVVSPQLRFGLVALAFALRKLG